MSILNAHRAKYLVVGAYAVAIHAQPRATKDLDILVKADPENARAVFAALAEFGAPLQGLTSADFQEPGPFFRMGREPVGVDILTAVPGVEFDAAWSRRIEDVFHEETGLRTNFISREDLLAAKRAAGRWQDLADIMDDSIRIAGQAGISSLYHYQDFHADRLVDVERLVDVLENHRVYCSDPADFNDPWDCKPYFDPALLDDPANRLATAESFITTQRGGPKGDRMDELLRTSPTIVKGLVRRFSEDQPDFVRNRWRLYCLSPDPCLTLMWSHYSRNHKAICLEFGVPGSKFACAQKVRYRKEYPPLLVHDLTSYSDMLITKSDVWTYEQEHCCPAISRRDSIGYKMSRICFGYPVAEVPVEWALARKS
ncbi:MAG: DUF2971 domain-containing protein [Bryobacteraceae bacterium]